ncbi:hypothetical protein AB4Y36_39545 [Paraburkholderia sp. BR10936]|uniref:hypothetical protein n=1 Tax=Paraburkholderia sp. BR10936 TaxID=3236993 RepID=UPI0034D31BC5
MRELAEMFPGAILVFSTLRDALTAKEIASIGKLAKFGRRHWKAERSINPVLILTGTELLGWNRPPTVGLKRSVQDSLTFTDYSPSVMRLSNCT